MVYKNSASCVKDLEQHGHLRRIDLEVDPYLELAAIQRRVLQRGGPALLFTRARGTAFPLLGNVFGTRERVRFIFRDSLRAVESVFHLASDPGDFVRHWSRHWRLPLDLWHGLPKTVSTGPVLARQCGVEHLPHLTSWPGDGGAFITLPQVYTEDPAKGGWLRSNLGMYRVQLSGGNYAPDEVGLHYQIHRGIEKHHAIALARGESLRVNIFVGGPPAMTLASVMPCPDGIPELAFAGLLAGFRVPMIRYGNALPILAEADFCLSGHILPELKPEGPFGDHLGYYSLAHDFPVLKVERVMHREGAVWPFTCVGRPPQEDSVFGEIIHELTEPLLGKMFTGVREVHAVDAAGVHPLLLAVGSERYTPYQAQEQRLPQELITSGLALLGNTQTSLAKYLIIGAREDNEALCAHDVPQFFQHVLERTHFDRDLHFITRSTMDTLDYSGSALNQGAKLLWTVAGNKIRELGVNVPDTLSLPPPFRRPRVFAPGILILEGGGDMAELVRALNAAPAMLGFPLLVVVDDVDFCTASWDNFLWTTFTRSDPATDICGRKENIMAKHWTCEPPLIIDARIKQHHAPALESDPAVERRVDQWAAPGGPLHGIC